mmetsp:Transcript_104952/g.306574  ORF Transcript_104952/g.306574 Transcript_104952/m.306574 type:complete len:262 (+) Transcript_104952:1316-2101(+)
MPIRGEPSSPSLVSAGNGAILRDSSIQPRSSSANFTALAIGCGQAKIQGVSSGPASLETAPRASRKRAQSRCTRWPFSAKRPLAMRRRVSKCSCPARRVPSTAKGTSSRRARVRSCTITRRRPKLMPLSRKPASRATSRMRCAVSTSAHSAWRTKGSSRRLASVPRRASAPAEARACRASVNRSQAPFVSANSSWLIKSHSPPLEAEESAAPRKTAMRPLHEEVVTTEACALSHVRKSRIGASKEPFGLRSSEARICSFLL